MDIQEAIRTRHSVRSYMDKAIPEELVEALEEEVRRCNQEGDLHIQLVTEEPAAFDSFMAHYGKFSCVKNYIAMVGPQGPELEEKLGWYGERLVLKAQMLGLNTCWVALTFSKRKSHCQVEPGEKLVCVIALGYGTTQGEAHKSRPVTAVCRVDAPMPDWFRLGVEAALLAPTAVNQQKFRFTLSGDTVRGESTGGFYSKVDLGIVKYHFELGAGKENFRWAESSQTSRC